MCGGETIIKKELFYMMRGRERKGKGDKSEKETEW